MAKIISENERNTDEKTPVQAQGMEHFLRGFMHVYCYVSPNVKLTHKACVNIHASLKYIDQKTSPEHHTVPTALDHRNLVRLLHPIVLNLVLSRTSMWKMLFNCHRDSVSCEMIVHPPKIPRHLNNAFESPVPFC